MAGLLTTLPPESVKQDPFIGGTNNVPAAQRIWTNNVPAEQRNPAVPGGENNNVRANLY